MGRMFLFLAVVLCATTALVSCGEDGNPATPTMKTENPVVVMETTLGDIAVELYPLRAPITVGNFLRYVYEGFYDSLTFHRVIPNFIVQGGGFDENMQERPTHDPIPNEADNGLSNKRGTIAMARTSEIHSATSQFFINLKDNITLDHRNDTTAFGYAVFGEVITGWGVVDSMSRVETAIINGYPDAPLEPVIILRLYPAN